MEPKDLMYYHTNKKDVELTQQCKTENGIEEYELPFFIHRIVGAFEQVVIRNQYGRKIKINPNQIEEPKKIIKVKKPKK